MSWVPTMIVYDGSILKEQGNVYFLSDHDPEFTQLNTSWSKNELGMHIYHILGLTQMQRIGKIVYRKSLHYLQTQVICNSMHIRTDEDVQSMFSVHEQVKAFTKCIKLFVDVADSVSGLGDMNNIDRGHMFLYGGSSNENDRSYLEHIMVDDRTVVDLNVGFDLNIAPAMDTIDLNRNECTYNFATSIDEIPATLNVTPMNESGNICCYHVCALLGFGYNKVRFVEQFFFSLFFV